MSKIVKISIFIIAILTLSAMGNILFSDPSSPSPLVQAAQIAGSGFSLVVSGLLVLLYA